MGKVTGLSVDGIMEWVTNALQSSRVMPAGFAMSDIAHLGFVVEAPPELLANTPFALFNELSERLKVGTSDAGMYLGVYRNNQMPPHTTTLRMLASTPTLPMGIQGMVAAARREGNVLREKVSRSVGTLDLGAIADFSPLPPRVAAGHRRLVLGHSTPDAAARGLEVPTVVQPASDRLAASLVAV